MYISMIVFRTTTTSTIAATFSFMRMFMCAQVCERACGYMRACTCVRARVCAWVLRQHSNNSVSSHNHSRGETTTRHHICVICRGCLCSLENPFIYCWWAVCVLRMTDLCRLEESYLLGRTSLCTQYLICLYALESHLCTDVYDTRYDIYMICISDRFRVFARIVSGYSLG
jgi:hypothetical protein